MKANSNSSAQMQVPKLPDLPSLPSIPGENSQQEQLPQLPSFPNTSFGDKFSQNTIKEAVSGKKEVGKGGANEFGLSGVPNNQMMQKPFSEDNYDEMDEEIEDEDYDEIPAPSTVKRKSYSANSPRYLEKKNEPIFVRLDKFEESLEIFEKAKEQVRDIEHHLAKIKDLKQKEEEELSGWEEEIQSIKNQIEKIDSEVFSKVE